MAVNLGINNFIQKFDGGSKPTLYQVIVTGLGNYNDLQFFCKATSLPASTIGEIPVPYLGRVIKVPGDRTFDDWSVTVLNTENMTLRRTFEDWNNALNEREGNIATVAGGSVFAAIRQYEATVNQLDRKGNVVRSYRLFNMFPKEVSNVELGYDQVDVVSEFTVTFAYSHFTTTP
jgi:hypothetical protein